MNPDDEWQAPSPAHECDPTWAPAALALGLTMAAFGVLTHWLVGVAGGVVALLALVGWWRELFTERREGEDEPAGGG